jgi:hypothetical protein
VELYLKIEPNAENPKSPSGFVFVANIRALASSASVFREVVYDFRELAPVAHASRTSTPRIVERMMRTTGGLNIAHNTEDR